jgi:hypothetical protein
VYTHSERTITMTMNLAETLTAFEPVLNELTPEATTRLRPGLSHEDIQAQCNGFQWSLPDDVATLYQWHDGLTRIRTRLTLIERVLRQKDKWHGELSGRDNEIHFPYADGEVAAKFMPLEYALAGHRHLKLGRCPLDLLPVFILHSESAKWYCMFRLVSGSTTVYCVNGTKVPPKGIGEGVLAANPQFKTLAEFISFLSRCGREFKPTGRLSPQQLQSILSDYIRPIQNFYDTSPLNSSNA